MKHYVRRAFSDYPYQELWVQQIKLAVTIHYDTKPHKYKIGDYLAKTIDDGVERFLYITSRQLEENFTPADGHELQTTAPAQTESDFSFKQ